MNSVSERIKHVLKRFDWSEADLARECRVKRQAVNKWVAGTSKPRQETLLPLQQKHGIDARWILYSEGEMIIKKDDSFVESVREAEPYLDDDQKRTALNVILSFARGNGLPTKER